MFKNLEYIDQPLVSKRSSKRRSMVSSSNFSEDIKNESSMEFSLQMEEEQKKRKNRDQIEVLKSEYAKNPNWTRPYVKDLSKRLGLKTS